MRPDPQAVDPSSSTWVSTAARAGGRRESRGRGRRSPRGARAASATVVAKGPIWSRLEAKATSPYRRHDAVGGLHADDAAQRGRLADRAAGVGAQAERRRSRRPPPRRCRRWSRPGTRAGRAGCASARTPSSPSTSPWRTRRGSSCRITPLAGTPEPSILDHSSRDRTCAERHRRRGNRTTPRTTRRLDRSTRVTPSAWPNAGSFLAAGDRRQVLLEDVDCAALTGPNGVAISNAVIRQVR